MAKGTRGGKRQIATKARFVENMNEAQIDKEIRKEKSIISRANKTMGINLDSAEEKSFREAFPLGTGGLSKGKAEKTAGRLSESALGRSQKYTKAMKDKESAERRLSTLQKAKKEVKGTGKTQKQLAGERKKKAGSASTMKWTQTRETGIYGSTTVRKSGNITIRSTGGTHFIYKNGKQIGMSSKLSEAKALAERVK